MSLAEWDRNAAKRAEEKKGEDIRNISAYEKMLCGKELLDSENIKSVLNEGDREFLKANLNQVLFKNDALKEALPFMKDIKGMDQLDKLTQEQFEQLNEHLMDNICKVGLKEALEKEKKNEFFTKAVRQNVLLSVFGERMVGEGLKQCFGREIFRAKNLERARQMRISIMLGKEANTENEGKLRYRFEDIPAKRADGDVITKRRMNFKKSAAAWKKIEALGPEAVEQMQIWILQLLGEKNTKGVARNRNAKLFLAYLSGLKTCKVSWRSTVDINKTMPFIYTIDPALQEKYGKRAAKKVRPETS